METNFKTIGIIYNPDIAESIVLAKTIAQKIKNSLLFPLTQLNPNIDLAVAIGGDGTFLRVARFYSTYQTPTLGFNVGRLGYLAQAGKKEVDFVIEKLNSADFEIENRLMLKSDNNTALNDIVIKGENTGRTSTLDLYINDKKLCSYVADGLIISTPTGSTAYSLSAGGPIVSPKLDCFLIIPICPHTLNTRPLVIPTDEKITIKALENINLHVSFDGQVNKTIKQEINIEKNEKSAKLLILNKQKDKFYDILKEKLHWSIPLK